MKLRWTKGRERFHPITPRTVFLSQGKIRTFWIFFFSFFEEEVLRLYLILTESNITLAVCRYVLFYFLHFELVSFLFVWIFFSFVEAYIFICYSVSYKLVLMSAYLKFGEKLMALLLISA